MKKIAILILIATFLVMCYFVINPMKNTQSLDDFISDFIEESNKDNLPNNTEALLPYFYNEEALTKAIMNRTISITNFTCQDSNLNNKYTDYTYHQEDDTITLEVKCGTEVRNSLIEIVQVDGQYKIKNIFVKR